MNHFTIQEDEIIRQIKTKTEKKNIDNISRTNAYFRYFKKNPDIIWSFLAHMVSRNGGWNMCDLEGSVFPQLLEPKIRKQLFLTYERANWLIFHDVFPQLLIYQYSTKLDRPMFHLLPFFNVSSFIQKEWFHYWNERDKFRMTKALIINEQNVIQAPIIEHPVYKKKVFRSMIFTFQDWLHFSCVLFPTCGGEVYGSCVTGFRSVSKRIQLGKRLADILFHPRLFPYFFEFANRTPHTGSRYDYEQYFKTKFEPKTPILRAAFPVIEHHQHMHEDWSRLKHVSPTWLHAPVIHQHSIHLTDWYFKKMSQLELILALKKSLD
ncbi:hypothetical protein BIV60_00775 [Bacillus sp. MUM 116]|uniref:DUF2515 domain-containing protein n=1 Tax=Bacillus sp. MUM 116 TaxID=1678002 RepID=UPI0008F5AE2B|nr:DUF2515 domain-containing protein [Bacillus sp. MUM 116]OIK17092.1 hypothetical protein BIV60_00775 [Bacillus sp. MUM 116]